MTDSIHQPQRRLLTALWTRFRRPGWLVAVTLAAGTFALLPPAAFSAPLGLRLALAVLALTGVILLGVFIARRLELIRQLQLWTERMRGGDLHARIDLPADPGLSELIEDINSLGGMLKNLALHFDAQSRARNVRLARKTQSLDILYEVALSLTRPGTLDQQLTSFLDTFIEMVDARAAGIHLLDGNGRLHLIAGRRLDPLARSSDTELATRCPHCGWTLASSAMHVLDESLTCARLTPARASGREAVVVPVQYHGRALGAYALYLDWPVSYMGEDAIELFISIGRHLGLAIEKDKLDQDARRLAIMEERQTLANELHDSLAQALVGIRLRVKMLGESLHRRDWRASANEVRTLRAAIEDAHASLRELLANFRLKMDERGLIPALEDMIARFGDETGIAVFFQNECADLRLTTAQEIQVFYIVREALTNIRAHSHACNARVLLSQPAPEHYQLLIEDDGEGIGALAAEGSPGEHIGLSVMRDRAQRLPGDLQIESEPGEGTRLVLTFALPSVHTLPRAVGD